MKYKYITCLLFCLVVHKVLSDSEEVEIVSEVSVEEQRLDVNISEQVSLNVSSDIDVNSTAVNVTQASNATNHVSCLLNETNNAHPVEIVKGTRLLNVLNSESNITSRQVPATCILVLFYSPSCCFSCQAAPHYNALPRVFPDIKMVAVDAMAQFYFNAQYGIVGVPTLVLFHNGRPVAKFNDSSDYTLEAFSKFVTKYTGVNPDKARMYVTSADFGGPISSVLSKEVDYCLIASWAFILVCCVYSFYQSSWWRWLVDATLSAWREAEAQHHHVD